MPAAIPNGGGGSDTTTSELAAYSAAKAKPPGNQTAQDQKVIATVEQSVTTVAGGWVDTGGTGGRQSSIALEAADFAGRLEADRVQAINQHAEEATGGSHKAKKAQSEMHGADTKYLIELARTVFELRERLNDSPY